MIEAIKEGLQDSRKALNGYRWFGSLVEEALSALDEIARYVDEPQPEDKGRITSIVQEMRGRMGPYSGFVPVLVDTLKKLEVWLEIEL